MFHQIKTKTDISSLILQKLKLVESRDSLQVVISCNAVDQIEQHVDIVHFGHELDNHTKINRISRTEQESQSTKPLILTIPSQ